MASIIEGNSPLPLSINWVMAKEGKRMMKTESVLVKTGLSWSWKSFARYKAKSVAATKGINGDRNGWMLVSISVPNRFSSEIESMRKSPRASRTCPSLDSPSSLRIRFLDTDGQILLPLYPLAKHRWRPSHKQLKLPRASASVESLGPQ